MINNGISKFVITVGHWIVHLAYLNFLWIVHAAMGLVVLGVFPATAGLFSVIRQRLKHGSMTSVWKVYHDSYKREFLKLNMVGYLYLIVGAITYIDFKFFYTQGGAVFTTLSYTVLVILLIYVIMGLFLFPVLVHYDLKTFSYFKYTFLITISRPGQVMLTVLILAGVGLVMNFGAGLIVFYGLSIPAYIIMWFAYNIFKKVDEQSKYDS